MKTAPQDIILGPIITESSMKNIQMKKYTFKVTNDSTKVSIAMAVEDLFNVKVAKVNTMKVRGQYRRQGAHGGYTASFKKAIVTLAPGSKGIEFFETMT